MPDYRERMLKVCKDLPENVLIRQIDEQGRYWLLSDGRLLSVCREQPIFKQFYDNGDGYLQTDIGNRKYYLHRLLALYFNADEEKEQIKQSCDIHHLDRNKHNNNLSNLCIVSKERHQDIHNLWNKLDKLEELPWEQMENIS